MKLVHLILAHTAPVQLERLIKKLAHPNADIYIHLDKKAPIEDYFHLEGANNVRFIKKRTKVGWGTYSIVEATISSIKEIQQTAKSYHYFNLLSGQDYPLTSSDALHQYLDEHPGIAYMNYLLMDTEWREALPRIESYHFHNWRISGKYLVQFVVNLLLPKRKFPLGYTPIGRSQWFTIPMDCMEYIMEIWNENPQLRQFIKWTWAPDEFIFQTILYNSPYKGRMINKDLRYIDWSAGGVSPKTLTMEDADAILSSGEFYARKFDLKRDPQVFDVIDQHAEPSVQVLNSK